MKRVARILLVVLVLAGLTLPLTTAGAQSATGTLTLTESQINNSYRVTNPWRRAVTNVSVDLQAGQVVISSTQTYRRASYAVVATYTPRIQDGRIYWTLVSATANGQPASQELIDQVNASISSSWRNYLRQQAGPGRVQSVTIADADITIAYVPRR
jgi:hypothetical protein